MNKAVYIVREQSSPPFKYVYEHCYKIGMSRHWPTRRKYYVTHGYDILWWMPVSHPRILEHAMKHILCSLACSPQNTEVYCFTRGHRALARLIKRTWKELRTFVHKEYGFHLGRKNEDTASLIQQYVTRHRNRYKWVQRCRIRRSMVNSVRRTLK
jgi:hypothetical protein